MISCESVDENERTINAQGYSMDGELTLSENRIELDSVSYSTGIKHYILKGEFLSKDSIIQYNLYITGNPLMEDFDLLSQTYPLRNSENKRDFKCDLKVDESRCDIIWSDRKSRLYIRDFIIAGR